MLPRIGRNQHVGRAGGRRHYLEHWREERNVAYGETVE